MTKIETTDGFEAATKLIISDELVDDGLPVVEIALDANGEKYPCIRMTVKAFEDAMQKLGYYRLQTVLGTIETYVEEAWHREQTVNYTGPHVIGHPANIVGSCPYCGSMWYDLSWQCCPRHDEHPHIDRTSTGRAICSACNQDVTGDPVGVRA